MSRSRAAWRPRCPTVTTSWLRTTWPRWKTSAVFWLVWIRGHRDEGGSGGAEAVDARGRGNRHRDRRRDLGLEPAAARVQDARHQVGQDGWVGLERLHRRRRLRGGAEGTAERDAQGRRIRRRGRRRLRGRPRLR